MTTKKPSAKPTGETTTGKAVSPRNPTRDSERTRASIIRHSTREFSTRGFDGARVDRIAARCRLSKNTLYYHFRSKDGLIAAVLESMYSRLRARQEEKVEPAENAADELRQIVERTFQAFIDNPEIIRLLNEENLHKASHIKKSHFLKQLYDPLVDRIAGVLARGTEQGLFQAGLDPVAVYITMSSMAYHFLSNSYTLEIALGRELSSKKSCDSWALHISEVVLTYCRGAGNAEGARPKLPARPRPIRAPA